VQAAVHPYIGDIGDIGDLIATFECVRDCKGYAPQNQSALAQRMIETHKAYLSQSRQLSWHLPEAFHNPEMCVEPVHVGATYVAAHFAHFPSLIELFCRQPIRIMAHGRAAASAATQLAAAAAKVIRMIRAIARYKTLGARNGQKIITTKEAYVQELENLHFPNPQLNSCPTHSSVQSS
jgi:hypothetical protein